MTKWLYFFVVSILIVIAILFATSFFMIKDSRENLLPRKLGFFICNPDAVISFVVLFMIMFFTVVVLQLLAYSDLYDQNEVCMPILFYFGGNTAGCKRAAARTASIQSQLYNVYSQIDEMKQYAKDRDEPFVGSRDPGPTTVTISFSRIVNMLNESYHTFVREFILYMMKLYRDIMLPLSRR